jgi:hypothetical protein
METIAIIVFGVVCFTSGFYMSTQVSEWIDSRIKPYTKEEKDSDIRKLSEKIEKFINQLTGGK